MSTAEYVPDDKTRDERAVATLRADENVEGIFACTRKERQVARSGTPYLTVELRDSSGSIVGRAFRDADRLAAGFERGDLVRVRGRVERFRGDLQVGLQDIERAPDADPARFLPTAYRDIDELDGFVEHLAREVYDPPLRGLLESLLRDAELRGELRRAPCALPATPGRAGSGHHAYLGGLLEHTVAVATLAIELCTVHAKLDRDLLLSAALAHDVGRAREFEYGAEITLSRRGAMVGHIELSLREIAGHAPASLAGERRLALEHCVLLHHGSDAASGRRFQSAEALALYRLNALDANVKGALERGLPGG